MGAKTCGSYKEGYYYIEEELIASEASELRKFCEYIDDEIGGAAGGNIQTLFKAFKHPDSEDLQRFAADLRHRINEIHNIIYEGK
jgi:hypothetical protein